MKKKSLIFFIIIIVAIGLVVAFVLKKNGILNISLNNSDNNNDDAYDSAIRILTNTVPTTIFLYGDDLIFRDGVQVVKIPEITEETLNTDAEYSVLIINDLSSSVSINSGEYQIIKDKLNNSKFSFYYLGNDKIKKFEDVGIFKLEGVVNGNLCTASTIYYGNRISWTGIFTENDKKVAEKNGIEGRPGEFILTHLVMCYGTNN